MEGETDDSSNNLKQRSPSLQARASDNELNYQEENVMTNSNVIPAASQERQHGSAQIFQFQQKHNVRTVVTNGCPWFYAADVCSAVALSDTNKALLGLDDDEKCEHEQYSGSGRKPLLISESGLYSLILRSRKPEAKIFRKWVTSEVLPSIRKTGSYSRDLESALTDIHGLAMEGLSQIEAVARVSLLAMQTPDAYRFPENIAMTLEVIWSIAQNIQGCVGSEAENVGCAQSRTASERRKFARHAAGI